MTKHLRNLALLAIVAIACFVDSGARAATYGKVGSGGTGSGASVTDTSLTGVGTVASPLGVNSWLARRMAAIQVVAPTLTNAVSYNTWSITGDVAAQTATGTGVAANAQTVIGGGWRLASGTTASSRQIINNRDFAAGAGKIPTLLTNPKTQPWAVVARVNFQVAPDANTQYFALGLEDNVASADWWAGVVGVDSTANLGIWINGAGATHFTSNLAIPTLNTWHDFAMVFDGTTLWLMLDDVKSSTGITDLSNFATGVTGNWRIFAANQGTAANKEFWLKYYAILTPSI